MWHYIQVHRGIDCCLGCSWISCTKLSWDHWTENYAELVNKMLAAYQQLSCWMSLRMRFLHSHLDFSTTNVDDTSDEHEKEFNQDISSMERGYQGHWNPNMMYNCYCFLQQSASDFQRPYDTFILHVCMELLQTKWNFYVYMSCYCDNYKVKILKS